MTIIGIIIGSLVIGFFLWYFLKKRKEKKEEVNPIQDLQIKIANLEIQGKVQNRDYQIYIISEDEYNKSRHLLKDWMLSRFVDKSGEFTEYTSTGIGLYEFEYITKEKIFDILFLIVDKTSQPVIITEPDDPDVETPTEDKNIYHITLDSNPEIDNTLSFQKQLDNIPDGTLITSYTKTANVLNKIIGTKNTESLFLFTRLGNVKYRTAILPKGEYRMEGDVIYRHLQDDGIVTIWNRRHLIIQGESTTEKTVFYTTSPATPYGGNVSANKYSYRRHIWLKGCEDIELLNIKVKGSNLIDGRKIGSSRELTPDFWWQVYTKGKHVPFWYIYSRESELLEGREIPEEIQNESVELVKESLYIAFLKEKLREGELVPASGDTGSIGGSPAYRADWEQEHALDIRDSKNIRIYNFDVDGVWGDGIYIGGSSNIYINNCHLRYTGRQGIAISNNVENVLIENIFGELGRRAFIDLEPDLTGYYIRNVEIRNCHTNTAQTVIAANGRGDVSDIYIHDITFSGGGHFIICYDSLMNTTRKNWRVENNERTGGFGSPIADIRFALTDNIIIKGNKTFIGATQSRKSAEFRNCKNVQINENDFGSGEFIVSVDSEVSLNNNEPEQILI